MASGLIVEVTVWYFCMTAMDLELLEIEQICHYQQPAVEQNF